MPVAGQIPQDAQAEARHRQPLVTLLSAPGKQVIERFLNAPGPPNERRRVIVPENVLY